MASALQREDRPVADSLCLDDLLDILRDLAPEARLIARPGGGQVRVRGVTLDSTDVVPCDLFAGLPGRLGHGADYASRASEAGAVALLSDRPDHSLPSLSSTTPARYLVLSARLYGDPSLALSVYGVTGTDGKTSTAHLLAAGLQAASHRLAPRAEPPRPDNSRRTGRRPPPRSRRPHHHRRPYDDAAYDDAHCTGDTRCRARPHPAPDQ